MFYRTILNRIITTSRDRSGSLSRNRRKTRQVGRDRRPIDVAEVSGGVFDDPGHGPAGHVAVGPEAGLQVIGQVARAPAADAVLGIGRDGERLEGAEGRLKRVPAGLRPCPGPGVQRFRLGATWPGPARASPISPARAMPQNPRHAAAIAATARPGGRWELRRLTP